MSRARGFSVYLTNDYFNLGLVGSIFFLFIVLMQFFSNDIPLMIGLLCFSPAFFMGGYLMLKTKCFRVTVRGEQITVRTIFGKYSFNVSEIVTVKWRITINGEMKAERLCIIAPNGKKVKIEMGMNGLDKMIRYISENVEEDKIQRKYVKLFWGDKQWQDHQ